MSASKRDIGSDLAKIDAHMIQPAEYDEAPELTAEFFDRAVIAINSVEQPRPRRGRPPSLNPKVHTRLRIDPDVLEHFKATGPGWQTRINAVLREAVEKGS